MRLNLFNKAKYFLASKQVKVINITNYSISFEVGKYHVTGKYQNHQLIWICSCKADANNDICSHKIASQTYLTTHILPEIVQSEQSEQLVQSEQFSQGLDHLSDAQKFVLKQMVGNKCQNCGLEKPLEIHRIKRGNKGGKYVPNNILVICEDCHQTLHGEEFK